MVFAEKVWSKAIWIARVAGIAFILIGLFSITGITSIATEDEMNDSQNSMNNMMIGGSNQDRDDNGMNMNDYGYEFANDRMCYKLSKKDWSYLHYFHSCIFIL